MTKIMVMPSSEEQIESIIEITDAFLLGVEDFSINTPVTFPVEKIKELTRKLHSCGKEVFLSVNKNMHLEDLSLLEDLLKELDSLPVTGILYYDVALVQLKEKNQYHFDLVWAQDHLVTNASTCNFWYEHGATYGLVAGEITLDEIIQMQKEAKMKLIVPIFGYLPMFASYRHLVDNYITTFGLKTEKEQVHFIAKEGNEYPILDNQNGTVIYSGHILNGLSESLVLKEHQIPYLFINTLLIETEVVIEVIKAFQNATSETVKVLEEALNQKLENTDKGFLYKETVYKVKNNG